jgi:hypothetical protein
VSVWCVIFPDVVLERKDGVDVPLTGRMSTEQFRVVFIM